MDSPKDIWHFARPLLAKQYLGEFDLGLISARALFAKRRMGKSTFLERDLIPAAKQAGYITPRPPAGDWLSRAPSALPRSKFRHRGSSPTTYVGTSEAFFFR